MNDKKGFFSGTVGFVAAILAAHIAGDVFLRIDSWFDLWRTTTGYLIHVLIWAGLISIVLAVYKLFTIPKFLFLLLTHYIIDTNKLYLFTYGRIAGYVLDQSLHLISIILVLIWPGVIMLVRKKMHTRI
jgi:membrane-associated protease RseP (regulator of RpoE activity)